jgi:hypothetical protein
MITEAFARATADLLNRFASAQAPNLHLAEDRAMVLDQKLTRESTPLPPVDGDDPFLLVTTPTSVIADHNDIFNARFITFLVEYVSLEEIKLTLTKELMPARRSGALAAQ